MRKIRRRYASTRSRRSTYTTGQADCNRRHDAGQSANTALIDGVRKFAMDVRELDIDLIDRINPFGEAYAILAKTMSEESLKQVASAIAAKRTSLTPRRRANSPYAPKFKQERGRLPSIDSPDAWEQRMAEGAAAFVRFKERAAMSDIDLDDLRAELDEFRAGKGGRAAPRAKNVSSRNSRRYSVSSKSTAPPSAREDTISSSGFTPSASTGCARWTNVVRSLVPRSQGLLGGAEKAPPSDEPIDEDELLAELEGAATTDITELRHVRPAPTSARPRKSPIAKSARTSIASNRCFRGSERNRTACARPDRSS